MKITQVAAQLYTCRDLLQTPADIAKTLKRIRNAGYTAVQVSAIGPISEAELNRILNGLGMTCCATHEPPADILGNPGKLLDRLKALDCKLAAYPFPSGIDLSSAETVRAWIQNLQRSGKVFEDAGLTLCYHNHNHEFRKLEGKTILELIYSGTSPAALQAELDTYWVQYGGGDIASWCERLAGRLPVIHMKDYHTTAQSTPLWCEIGAGVLDFGKIVAAAEAAGCQWYIVEQDTCPGDPVDSLAQSFRYIQENLVSA